MAQDFPDAVEVSAVYDFDFNEESKKFLAAATLADSFKAKGKIASVTREPVKAEFDLVEWGYKTHGDEMTNDEIGRLYFQKSSVGIIKQENNPQKHFQTGRLFGYRIIYGPDPIPAKIPPSGTVPVDFAKLLDSAVPAALVIEDIIGLGDGFVIIQNSTFYKLD